MDSFIGNNMVVNYYSGSNLVDKIFIGTNQIWEKYIPPSPDSNWDYKTGNIATCGGASASFWGGQWTGSCSVVKPKRLYYFIDGRMQDNPWGTHSVQIEVLEESGAYRTVYNTNYGDGQSWRQSGYINFDGSYLVKGIRLTVGGKTVTYSGTTVYFDQWYVKLWNYKTGTFGRATQSSGINNDLTYGAQTNFGKAIRIQRAQLTFISGGWRDWQSTISGGLEAYCVETGSWVRLISLDDGGRDGGTYTGSWTASGVWSERTFTATRTCSAGRRWDTQTDGYIDQWYEKT